MSTPPFLSARQGRPAYGTDQALNGEKRGWLNALPGPLRRVLDPGWRPGQAALAGALATVAYSVAMEGDILIVGNRFSDVRFIEGMLVGEKRSRNAFLLAWVIHFLNGVALAEVYAAAVKRWLPGPDWLKGALFGEAFVISVWTLTPLADKYHPLIKNGELSKLANWKSFFQNLLRHFVFGIALGLLYKEH